MIQRIVILCTILSMLLGGTVIAATRLGLHVTTEERAIWATRASNGPYRVSGDVRTNSPGSWTTILNNANASLSADRWAGYTGAGCVPIGNSLGAVLPRGDRVRDAAFVYLVTGTLSYRTAVVNELLAQAVEPGTDFGNTSKWCAAPANPSDNFFRPALWLSKYIYAYDYLLAGDQVHGQALSQPNKDTIEGWLLDAAVFNEAAVRLDVTTLFVSRSTDNYTLTSAGNTECTTVQTIPYFGGPTIHRMGTWWNNRRAAMAAVYGLVGVQQNNAALKTEATRFVKEYIRFSMFADGSPTEFERWTSTIPILGWWYTITAYGTLIQYVDALARAGDTSLYDYTTADGACGTAGGSKGITLLTNELAKYVDHTHLRYGTNQSGNNGNANYLIDSVNNLGSENYVGDHGLAQPNLYYRSNYLKTIYMRTAPGQNGYALPGYPVSPSHGGYYPWGSSWGNMPGVLFMFGQLEGVVDPYTIGGDSLPPKPPTGLTATTTSATAISVDCTEPTQNTDNSALTDLDSLVLRYCTNPGCTPTTTIDIGLTCPYSHTPLLSSTMYRYELAARDTSGNLSTWSTPIVEDTTDAPAAATLVLHHTFDSAAGAVSLDETANNHDGTIVGGATTAAGVIGNALVFDGVDDYVRVTRHANLEPSAITICAWIKRDGVQDTFADIVNKTWGDDDFPTFASYGLHASASPADVLIFYHGKTGGGESLTSSTGTLPDNVWTHICAVYNPTGGAPQKRLYVGGNLATPTATTTTAMIFDTVGTDNDLYFGYGTLAGRFFKGSLDDLRIYNGALSDAAIAELAIGTPPGPTPTLAQQGWRWRTIDSTETEPFQSTAGIEGRIVLNNQARLRTVIANTGDTTPLQGYALYARTPAGSGTWWPLDGDCITNPFCYGFDRRLDAGIPTTAQMPVGGLTFLTGGKFYELFGNTGDLIALGADQWIEREHAIRARPDQVIGTTVGFCERLGTGTELDSCTGAQEAIARVVPARAFVP